MASMLEGDGFAAYEEASPTTLAEQPPTAPEDIWRPDRHWELLYEHVEARRAAMRNWRFSWWTYWAKLAEYILPRRYHWLVTANLMRRGSPLNQAIIDCTAGLAKNICASGMVDGLIPTTRPWVKIEAENLGDDTIDADGKTWIEDTERRLYIVLAMSNFYETMAQVAEDEVTFGTAPVILYEDSERVINLQAPCAGEYYLAVSGKQRVDTLYREFTYTVQQIVDEFRLENCPDGVKELWRAKGGSLENEFVVCHAIEPNYALTGPGDKPVSVLPGKFTWREVYWLRGKKTARPLSLRGFVSKKPFGAFRWATTSNDPYGRGPGMDALGDTIQLQIQTRRKGEAIEKQVRPPMGADPQLKNEPASINPGHITYVETSSGKKGFWSLYDVKIELSALIEDMGETRQRIDRCFLRDVWMAISDMEGVQPRNNLEIAERKNEKMQRLGPVVGLWKSEMRDILIRVLEIMERKGLLKPRPRSIRGVGLKFTFLDMVTMAQLGAQTAAMEQGFKMGGELSLAAKQAAIPDPLRIINMDEAYRIYLDRLGFPQKAVFAPREVKAHDQARAAATQQRQMGAAPAAALPAVQAAETLAKIPPGGGSSVLGQLLNGGNAPAGAGAGEGMAQAA